MTQRCLIGVVVLLSAGCAPEPVHLLAIDLRSDLVAPEEIDHVDVVLAGEHAARHTLSLDGSEPLASGVRAAELELPAGPHELTVTAWLGETIRAERPLIVALSEPTVATVYLSRRCVGVTCPPADAPRLSSCLAGRCVDPRCTAERREYCGESECVTRDDCELHSECAAANCASGVCLYASDASVCAPGERCDVDEGCLTEPGVVPRLVDAAGQAAAPDASSDSVEVEEEAAVIASASAFFRKEGDGAGWVAASLEVPAGTLVSRSTTSRETMGENHLWADDAVVTRVSAGTVPLATVTSEAGYRSDEAALAWGLVPLRFTGGYHLTTDGSPIELELEEAHVLVASTWLSARADPPARGYSREAILVDGALCNAGRQDAVADVESLDGSALCVRPLAPGVHAVAATGEASGERLVQTTTRALLIPERRVAFVRAVAVDATDESRAARAYLAIRDDVVVEGPSLLVAHAHLRATDDSGFLDGHVDVDGEGCGRSRHVRAADGSDAEVAVSCVRYVEEGAHEVAVGHYHEGPIVPDRYELGYVVIAVEP